MDNLQNLGDLDAVVARLQLLFTDFGVEFGLRILAAIAIFFIGRWLARIVKRVVRKIMIRAGVDSTLISFSSNLAFYGAMAFVVLAALGQLGIETASLIALLGAAGLAVGLALQGSLANFAAGVLIVVFRHFRVGDWIEAGGVSGFVEDIQLVNTIIRSLDNRTIVMPNSTLTGDTIINLSAKGLLRLDLLVGVAYEEDIDQVKRVIYEEIAQEDRILSDPAPLVGLIDLNDSSVDFTVRAWVRPEHFIVMRFVLLERIKKRLDAEDITIPFPQRDVHLFSEAVQATSEQTAA